MELVSFVWVLLIELIPYAIFVVRMGTTAYLIVLYLKGYLLLCVVECVHYRTALQQVLVELLREKLAGLVRNLLAGVDRDNYGYASIMEDPTYFLALAGTDYCQLDLMLITMWVEHVFEFVLIELDLLAILFFDRYVELLLAILQII